jgi:predicted transcriptional regulator YheO
MKVSNIVNENHLIDSNSFKSLSPLMKEAVKDLFKLLDNKGNLIFNFENAVSKVAKYHNINEKVLYEYIEKETNEQLGEK